jgi:hypothetical protein
MKTSTLQVRLLPSEKEAFEEAAESADIALSAWVRERLRLAAIRDLEGSGKSVSFGGRVPLRTEGHD